MATIDFTDSIYDAQQGSQSAIKFIYDNTIQLFYKEANAFLRDKDAADRAIRDAYVFIFDHLSSLEDTSKFLLWANEVCKNTCISMLSDAGVFDERVPAEAINLGEISAASDYDAQINMSANMSPDYIQECLEAILSALPDNQRACAILWGEGYPIRSISRKLGISPVAVNYTLAYTLGNITNAVNALSANGLPLYSMEPIPYFLWLLMSYYQYYQPGEIIPGSQSSFSNILRVLMPGEASVFSAGLYDNVSYTPDQEADSLVRPVTDPSLKEPAADSSLEGDAGEDLDISSFIRTETKEPSKEPEESHGEPEPASDVAAPEVVVFHPHEKEASGEEHDTKQESQSSDTADTDETTKAAAEADAETAAKDSASQEISESGSVNADKSQEAKTSDIKDTKDSKESADAAGKEETAETGDTQTEHEKVVDDILFGALAAQTPPPEKPRKRSGLIIVLIVIIAILCLLIAAMFLFKEQVNKILGTNLFNTTQVTGSGDPAQITAEEITGEEAETEAPTPEEVTTEEPTTEEPTTEEPTTEEPTTEEVLGPEFDVTINLGGSSLAMHATPTNDNERLVYIPDGEQVHISEVQDGWGHTTYEGYDGWIWLEFTKVAGNALVQQPEEGSLLAEPEPYTLGYAESGNQLRMLPGSYSATFGEIPEGTQIMVEAYYEDSWTRAVYAYTTYEGHHGWVYLYTNSET